MDIDDSAPVRARARIEIDAPREKVWGVMTDFERWPAWNPDVSNVEIDGEVAPGTEFRWKAGPGTIRSRLQEVQPPTHLAWTGSTMGIRAVHVWHLESRGGATVVTTAESWRGLLPWMLRRPMSKTLGRSIERGLDALKQAVEG